jgi:NAD dependent epimerase/dehydratase family enzyme
MAEETILSSQRVLPVRLEEAGYRFVHPDLTEALADLLRGS